MMTYTYCRFDFWRSLILGIAVGFLLTPFIAVRVADILLNQDGRSFVPHSFYRATWVVLMGLCAIATTIIARKRCRIGMESTHERDSGDASHRVIARDISIPNWRVLIVFIALAGALQFVLFEDSAAIDRFDLRPMSDQIREALTSAYIFGAKIYLYIIPAPNQQFDLAYGFGGLLFVGCFYAIALGFLAWIMALTISLYVRRNNRLLAAHGIAPPTATPK